MAGAQPGNAKDRAEGEGFVKKCLGLAMLATPFAVIAAFAIPQIGVVPTALIFSGSAAAVAWIWYGVKLALDALP